MKKIPTLFQRAFDEDGQSLGVVPKVTPGFGKILKGDGVATVKWDGACCAIMHGKFYKRYDAKHGKKPPKGAIPCCDPDPVTGHWPHWVEIDPDNPSDQWFIAAKESYANLMNLRGAPLFSGTYEAIGEHFQGNPYHLQGDTLVAHGDDPIILKDRSFEGIKAYLTKNPIEGIVFWKGMEPVCKIKRKDFGLKWPV